MKSISKLRTGLLKVAVFGTIVGSGIMVGCSTSTPVVDGYNSLTFEDKEIKITGVKVIPENLEQKGVRNEGGVELTIDGNSTTMFHSKYSGIPDVSVENVEFEFSLDTINREKLDYIRISNRGAGINGYISKADILCKSGNSQEFVKIGEVDASSGVIEVVPAIENPKALKLVVKGTLGDNIPANKCVALAEVALFSRGSKGGSVSSNDLKADREKFFTTGACDELKPNVTKESLSEMKTEVLKGVAMAILDNKYGTICRDEEYECYETPEALGKRMKIGTGYSAYEGITGMYLKAGTNVVCVDNKSGVKIGLIVPYWMRKPLIDTVQREKDPAGWGLFKQNVGELKDGPNVIVLEREGLVYVNYYSENFEKAPKIKVNFTTGEVNGYFDIAKNNNKDFDSLCDNVKYPILDVRGKHVQLAFRASDYIANCRGKGVELVETYDKMLGDQQYLLGWEKDKIVPKNRILARVNFNYYMFRDGDGMAYIDWAVERVCNAEHLKTGNKGDNCWGFNHEMGHVHQMQPQIRWGGMGEVSNNYFTLHLFLQHNKFEDRFGVDGVKKAKEYLLDQGKSLILLDGEGYDFKDGYRDDETLPSGTGLNYKLIPFYQLYVYFHKQYGDHRFFRDIHSYMRTHDQKSDSKDTQWKDMLEFTKVACDVTKCDLSEFFDRWGFFWAGKGSVNDYGVYSYDIPQSAIDEVKEYIKSKGYKKPDNSIYM